MLPIFVNLTFMAIYINASLQNLNHDLNRYYFLLYKKHSSNTYRKFTKYLPNTYIRKYLNHNNTKSINILLLTSYIKCITLRTSLKRLHTPSTLVFSYIDVYLSYLIVQYPRPPSHSPPSRPQ